MLSRVADSLYWINRYVERADHFARFLEISEALALDSGDEMRSLWQPLLQTSGVQDLFDEHYLICNASTCIPFLAQRRDNPSSIISCIAAARENARQIRDVITTEMWEQLNELHWQLQEDSFWQQPHQEVMRDIRRGCALFYGVMDASQSHDQAWEFGQLGRWIERADRTARLLEANWLLQGEVGVGVSDGLGVGGGDGDNASFHEELHWIGVLRCLGAYQMFRQHSGQAVNRRTVTAFLLLDPRFPRAVCHCVLAISDRLRDLLDTDAARQPLLHLDQLLSRLQHSPSTRLRVFRPASDLQEQARQLSRSSGDGQELEWLAGLLRARWSHLSLEELLTDGWQRSFDGLQADLNRLDDLIHERYLITPEPAASTSTSTLAPGSTPSGAGEQGGAASGREVTAAAAPLATGQWRVIPVAREASGMPSLAGLSGLWGGARSGLRRWLAGV